MHVMTTGKLMGWIRPRKRSDDLARWCHLSLCALVEWDSSYRFQLLIVAYTRQLNAIHPALVAAYVAARNSVAFKKYKALKKSGGQ